MRERYSYGKVNETKKANSSNQQTLSLPQGPEQTLTHFFFSWEITFSVLSPGTYALPARAEQGTVWALNMGNSNLHENIWGFYLSKS